MKTIFYCIIGAFIGGVSGLLLPILLYYFLVTTGSDKSVGQGLSFLPLFMIPLGVLFGAIFGPVIPKIIGVFKEIKEETNKNEKWNKYTKPPADICPKGFCFNWVPPGGEADMSGKELKSLEVAFESKNQWTKFPEGGCSSGFGICSRLENIPNSSDCYEANEPLLEKHNLPWFYFYPSTQILHEDFHEAYLQESKKIWKDCKE